MAISTDMIVRVAHADVTMDTAFPSSVRRWQRGDEGDMPWTIYPCPCKHLSIRQMHGAEIDGECTDGISAPNGGFIHINGNLSSRVDIDGHYELVVIGDVASNAEINASGICHMFVGGDFRGTLTAAGMCKLWIDGDFSGLIYTGTPMMEIHVGGNYSGRILPNSKTKPALLSLSVTGFAAEKSLTSIADCCYTVFRASVGISNVPTGIHPKSGYHRHTHRGNSFSHWCVHSEIGHNKSLNRSGGWTPNQN